MFLVITWHGVAMGDEVGSIWEPYRERFIVNWYKKLQSILVQGELESDNKHPYLQYLFLYSSNLAKRIIRLDCQKLPMLLRSYLQTVTNKSSR